MNQRAPATDARADDAAAEEAYAESYIAELSDETLAISIVSFQEALAERQRILHDFHAEVQRRIEAAGAKQLAVEGFLVELKHPPPTYDHGLLVALRELVTAEQFDAAFTPAYEHMVPVPQRWDGNKLNKLERDLGGDVAATIQRARIPGVPKVVVEKRGDA